ncbi:MAG: hypothetical protein J7M18_04750 [Candidatus Eremiobacteraeota bacterium]|nr:hypothetical protein [Candidatus Eremiobacteraeota bacterium]
MKIKKLSLFIIASLSGWLFFGYAYPSQVITGRIISTAAPTGEVKIIVKPGLSVKLYPGPECIILDPEGLKIPRSMLLPGDEVSVNLNPGGEPALIKTRIRTVSGIITYCGNGKIILDNGASFIVPDTALITVNGHKTGISKIKPMMTAFIRTPVDDNVAGTLDVFTTSKKMPAPDDIRLEQVFINHEKPFKKGETVIVTVNGSPSCEATIDLLGGFHSEPMEEVSPGIYRARFKIPAGLNLRGTRFIARIEKGKKQSMAVSPPLDIAADPPKLSNPRPAPGNIVSTTIPLISASIYSPGTPVLQEGIKLTLDERPIISGSMRIPSGFVFKPEKPLAPGKHTVKVQLRDRAGNIMVYKWNFTVTGD